MGESEKVVEEEWDFRLQETTKSYEFMGNTYYDWRNMHVKLWFVNEYLMGISISSDLSHMFGYSCELRIECYVNYVFESNYGEECLDFALDIAERAFKKMEVKSATREVSAEDGSSQLKYREDIIA